MKWRFTLDHPRRTALRMAGGYVLAAGLYIVLSGWLATQLAHGTEHLAVIEQSKGLVFVLVTGALVYVMNVRFLRRIREDERQLEHRTRALLRSERRAIAAVLAGGLAHDANNLITVMNFQLAGIAADPGLSPESRAGLVEMEEALRKLAEANRRLMLFSRGQAMDTPQSLDLAEPTRAIAGLAASNLTVRGCQLATEIAGPVPVRLDPGLYQQAVFNLLLNAAEATGGQGRLLVHLRAEGRRARLEVHDNGPGVPPALQAAVFQPFFTTKPTGHGLGLAAVRGFVEQVGGQFQLSRSHLGGACFTLDLPLDLPEKE